MASLHLHDVVELNQDFGHWPKGTIGAIVDEHDDRIVVELVGPAGETLDLLELAPGMVRAIDSHDHDDVAVSA